MGIVRARARPQPAIHAPDRVDQIHGTLTNDRHGASTDPGIAPKSDAQGPNSRPLMCAAFGKVPKVEEDDRESV